MAKLSKFKVNLDAAKNGVVVDLGDGLSVRVARTGNENYTKYLKQVLRPYEKMLRAKTMPDETFNTLYIEAIAETVLVGWEGLQDDDGTLIPYSKEKAIEILSNPEYEDFKKLVLDLADEQAVFAAEVTEDTK